RDLDILTTRHQNVPERHRSMRVVLAQSWQRLTETEREVFKRLSVFRGGFASDAARTVAGASLIDLATFVDKSLLHVTSTERYCIHELLRQYAAERLAEVPETVTKTYEAHCATYVDFLEQRSESLMGGQQRQALIAIAAEYDNAWAAWRWALKGLKLTEMQKLVMPLQLFCQFQSRYLEGADAWEEAYRRLTGIEATDPVKLTLVNVIVWWGWLLIRLGRLDQAETVLKQCCDLYGQLGIPPVPGYGTNPRLHLSLIATIRGDYATAVQYGEQAHRESETHQHQVNLCESCYVLASATSGQGDYETAQRYARQAYALAQQRDDYWYTAFCLIELGNIALALGDIATAQQHFEASYTLRKEFNDPGGMAVALNHLGEIALRQQAYEQAQQLYRESVDLYRNIFDKGGLAQAYQGLGTVASRQGDLQTAQQYLQQALRLTMEIEYVPLTLSILSIMGELLLNSDRPEPGLLVLAFVQQQAGGNPTVQDEARKRLDKYRAGAQKEQIDILEMAQERAKNQTLAEVVAEATDQGDGGLPPSSGSVPGYG
ncbi:MAG TPA: tetratricopeptide repeat protein, partial [Anaerolineae bacterium]